MSMLGVKDYGIWGDDDVVKPLQKWRKLGHVYAPEYGWTHASTPTVMHISGDLYRVYFAQRDTQNRGHVFSLDIDMREPTKRLNLHGPLLGPGPRGSFDDSGLSPACVDGNRLFYLGWNLGVTVPFRNSIGVAYILGQELMGQEGPVLDRTYNDPYTFAYPWVINNRMWYGSNLGWGNTNEDMAFVMKHAVDFGGDWAFRRQVMGLQLGERAIVRPSIIKDRVFRMWYAIKAGKYRIGYAESPDGYAWTRIDNVDLHPSYNATDFDSDEVTYPCVFRHGERLYMLYNGNKYGKTGFGIATEY